MSIANVEKELALDLASLERAENSGAAAFRAWTTEDPVVVVGRSVAIDKEIDREFCERHGIGIVGRASGGRSVLVGTGTVQYSFTLPYALSPDLDSISGSKTFCNKLLCESSPELSQLTEDPSGDLLLGDRKVAGLALKRGRSGMLLHGTILVSADLNLISQALRHPEREPTYRAGRRHEDFLENLGSLDHRALEAKVIAELAAATT